jgi:hypothetical protein
VKILRPLDKPDYLLLVLKQPVLNTHQTNPNNLLIFYVVICPEMEENNDLT